ncbi:MAG: hypothetical protein JSU96_18225 [Acidobacteriota bacterium]|nr:MAG: hypothetical protein JSU96_18225 [Acidobacteriota bacterium]
MHNETIEPDFQDQYIAVLLEFYAVKMTLKRPSPIERAKLTYWQKMVRAYERTIPEPIRSRIRYRSRRGEAGKLSPVQIALVRYAWNEFLMGTSSEAEIIRRWEDYYLGQPSQNNGNMVDFEVFSRKRQFREVLNEIREALLWPWNSS